MTIPIIHQVHTLKDHLLDEPRPEHLVRFSARPSGDEGVLVLMRGIPGSGKTTVARQLCEHIDSLCLDVLYLSADDYWRVHHGDASLYYFDPEIHTRAHDACLGRFLLGEFDSPDVAIVDNTNTRLWECSPYLMLARSRGRKAVSLRMATDVETCIEREQHGVGPERVRKMHERFEDMPSYLAEEFLITDDLRPAFDQVVRLAFGSERRHGL